MSPAIYAEETPRDPTRPWAPSPFRRLARSHAFSVAGDAIFTTTIAGLVFFNVTDLKQARWQVALALVFTFLPFTLAAPFIGPLVDRARGGRKWMIVGLSALRAVVCAALILTRSNVVALYPLFLIMLVLSKGYVIARGAIVPSTVRSDRELVEANSKLAAISGFAAVAGGAPSLLIMKVAGDVGPDLALALAGVVFAVSAVLAVQLPAVRTAALPPDEREEVELESEGIRHASRSVGFGRGVVGFLTFLLAFYFKDLEGNEGLVGIGVSVVGAQLGFMVGAWAAPRARKLVSEERMLMIALAISAVTAVLTALMGDIAGAALLSFGVGLTSNAAKQAFDALVQRDAPDANRGRAFARFETRFQLIWVLGALIPVAITIPIQVGFVLIAIGSLVSLAAYYLALRRVVAAARRRPSPLAGEPELVEPRLPSRSFLLGRRDRRRRADADVDGDGVLDATGFAIDAGLDPAAEQHRHPEPVDARTQGLDPGPEATAVVAAAPVRRWGATDDPTSVLPSADLAAPDDGATATTASPVAWADAPAAAAPPESLFAEVSDLGLEGGDGPREGLFAITDPAVAPAAPIAPDAALIDTEAWADEDALADPTGPRPLAAPVANGAPRAPDPGPPSLVPPAPIPPSPVAPAGVRPAVPDPRSAAAPSAPHDTGSSDPAPVWSPPSGRRSPLADPGPGDSGEFYGAPSDAVAFRPSAPVAPRPAPPAPASSSELASPARGSSTGGGTAEPARPAAGDEAPPPGPDARPPITDLYQDPPWRDAETPPLPGFEPEERSGT